MWELLWKSRTETAPFPFAKSIQWRPLLCIQSDAHVAIERGKWKYVIKALESDLRYPLFSWLFTRLMLVAAEVSQKTLSPPRNVSRSLCPNVRGRRHKLVHYFSLLQPKEGVGIDLDGKEWTLTDVEDILNQLLLCQVSVLLWMLIAACIKTGRPQIVKKALDLTESRLMKDGWPEYYDGKLGRYVGKKAKKFQMWVIAGYLVAKMMLEDPRHVGMVALEEYKAMKPGLPLGADS